MVTWVPALLADRSVTRMPGRAGLDCCFITASAPLCVGALPISGVRSVGALMASAVSATLSLVSANALVSCTTVVMSVPLRVNGQSVRQPRQPAEILNAHVVGLVLHLATGHPLEWVCCQCRPPGQVGERGERRSDGRCGCGWLLGGRLGRGGLRMGGVGHLDAELAGDLSLHL